MPWPSMKHHLSTRKWSTVPSTSLDAKWCPSVACSLRNLARLWTVQPALLDCAHHLILKKILLRWGLGAFKESWWLTQEIVSPRSNLIAFYSCNNNLETILVSWSNYLFNKHLICRLNCFLNWILGFTKNTLERFNQEFVILSLVNIKSPMKAFTAHKSPRIVYNCGYFLVWNLCGEVLFTLHSLSPTTTASNTSCRGLGAMGSTAQTKRQPSVTFCRRFAAATEAWMPMSPRRRHKRSQFAPKIPSKTRAETSELNFDTVCKYMMCLV